MNSSIENQKNKKYEKLGMSFGKAMDILRKSIIFYLVKDCRKNICYRCEKIIETEEELSYDHKIPWLNSEDPRDLFFDVNNIVFSHLSCNVKAERKQTVCPSRRSYAKGCRCNLCIDHEKTYHRNYQKIYRKKKNKNI